VLSELAGQDGRVIVVIDDLHELNSPDALTELSRLLTSLPGNGHAILATRHDPSWACTSCAWQASYPRFGRRTCAFPSVRPANCSMPRVSRCPTTARRGCTSGTEGWAAGLRLAALSLAGHPDPERFVTEFSGSDRTVAEYLVAEMLERQPGDVQDLLLRTCPLDRVNGELADRLTGRAGSERILLELEDANAFVVSLDPGRTWFRYHQPVRRPAPAGAAPQVARPGADAAPAAAEWFSGHGQAADAIRHTQAAGDWPDAARLLADHSFGLTMAGQAQTVHALLRAFPRGADYPELALVHAGRNLARGHLDEAAAHLAVAEAHAEAASADRRRRLRVAVASLKLSLATRRGHLAGVTEQARLLDSPVTGQSDEDIALGSDLRAVALMNLGTVEASLGLADAERHLHEGAALARKIGRPYLEVRCLAQLGFAAQVRPFATTRRRCREAIALAERHGWGAEWIIAPALITLAAAMAWTGEFDEGERWLERTERTLGADTGPDMGLLVDMVRGMLLAGRGDHQKALEQFSAAERRQSQLAGPHALASQVTGWVLAMQARLGMRAEARATIAALPDDRGRLW